MCIAIAAGMAIAVIVTRRAAPSRESEAVSVFDAESTSTHPEVSEVSPRVFAASLLTSSDDGQVRAGVKTLARSAALGDPEAQVALAGLLRAGHRAVPRDLAAARNLYGRAAEAAHPSAAYFLASVAAAGEGGPRDTAAAARWLSRGVELGSPHAMFLLANAYRAGTGVPRDEARALDLYRRAAERELPAALQTLAIVYERGELGAPADEDEARRYGLIAAHAAEQPVSAP